MKLASYDLYHYSLPFSRPLVLEGTTLHHREGLLLRLSGDDGSEGWGESAPLPGFSRESLDEAAEQLRRLAGSMTGRGATEDWVNPHGEYVRKLGRAAPSVRFGLELAVWNLCAAYYGKILSQLVAPSPRAVVPVNRLLAGSLVEVLEEARHMRNAGYSSVKLKVGARTVAEDVGLARSLGEEFGDVITLRLDANRAWSYEVAAEFLRAAPRCEYVEEPLADPARLPDLVRDFGVPVALDESLLEMDLEALDQHRYAQAFVLKPTLLGGISRTLRVAERARSLGVTPVVSSAYESGIGTAALVALSAGIGDRPVAAGLDTYRMVEGDVLEMPLRLPAPSVDVREAAETSRKVDVSKLEIL
jgi:o-succinylbenzoate synthase